MMLLALNPYPRHYSLAFAFSTFPYPQPYRLALRLAFLNEEGYGLTTFHSSNHGRLGLLSSPVAWIAHDKREGNSCSRYNAF
jgi:hypothetical protein